MSIPKSTANSKLPNEAEPKAAKKNTMKILENNQSNNSKWGLDPNENLDDTLFNKTFFDENDLEKKNLNSSIGEPLVADKNFIAKANSEETDEEVIHDFSLKRYPITLISMLKMVFKSIFGISAFIFHILIAFVICLIFNNIPIPSTVRGTIIRNTKSYIEHTINSTIGLWFPKEFYVAIDNRLISLFKNLEAKNENPCLLSISNHVTEFDWLFICKLNAHLNISRYTYLLVKKGVSNIPIMGYLMKVIGYTFIERERSVDPNKRSCDMISVNKFAKSIIKTHLDDRKSNFPILGSLSNKITDFLTKYRFIRKNPGANALYFPEATIFEESTYNISSEFYLKSKNRPEEYPGIFKPRYVLLPRPLGTVALFSKLSNNINCICDFTLLHYPYVSSVYNCISYFDIFACRAPQFAFGILVDYLQIPTEIKQQIDSLGLETSNFELPYLLTDKEKAIKRNTTKFLNNIYEKKDNIIQKYVKGSTRGNFKDLEDFENFIKSVDSRDRTFYSLKVSSKFKFPILLSSFLFFGICIYFLWRKIR